MHSIHGGDAGGTFVAKELVYAYAMWISPAFHLKGIRAYNTLVAAPALKLPTNMIEALRLAPPKVDLHDRHQNAAGA